MQSTAVKHSNTGGIVTALVLLVFITSLATAGFITFRLWRSNQLLPSTQPIEPSAPAVNTNDPLSPQFTIDPSLEKYRGQINEKLWQPLRDYYATRDQRLTSLTVTSSPDEEHQIESNLKLTNTDGSVQDITFFYDPDENSNLPDWTPSLLDKTE
ncbi:MAG: hypothetical protein U1C49_00490 [Candidatus Andersenbacteria bacterium]|nr:hypothetical protein [bacterium]MDZ4225303.1 hypothetical protein [Candidatus Andersenbacteria bacterium]